MPAPRLAALAFVAALLVPASADARTLGSGQGSGKRALAAATGDITAPRLIAVRVKSRPAQGARIRWEVVCKGLKQRSGILRSSGARFTKPLGLPRGKRTECFVVASVRLAGTGRVTLELLGH